jgi:hypothetical protein
MAGVTTLDANAFEAKALATTAVERFASMTRLTMTRFWRVAGTVSQSSGSEAHVGTAYDAQITQAIG